MSIELNTLAPKKWVGNYSGVAPTIDITDLVNIGDFALDNSTSPYKIWRCYDNTDTAPIWYEVFGEQISIETITTDETITAADLKTENVYLVDASSGAITVTLPALSTVSTAKIIIKKTDSSANIVTVDGNGSETIDGNTSLLINEQYTTLSIVYGTSEWYII